MARADVIRIEKELKGWLEGDIVDLAINLAGRFAIETPKKTGWCASNWDIFIGKVPTEAKPSKGSPSDVLQAQSARVCVLSWLVLG